MTVTFYSFKGGVGRSMALANVAELLAQRGYNVIVCDWDIEAPGLEYYMADNRGRIAELQARPGIIDLVVEYKDTVVHPMAAGDGQAREVPVGFEWVGGCVLRQPHTWAIELEREPMVNLGQLKFLPAGRRDPEWRERYERAVIGMDWRGFYKDWAGGAYLEFFRNDLNKYADIVLVDSRTGMTEIGGICTLHLADIVFVFTTANEENLEGSRRIVHALSLPEAMEYRRGRGLGIFPVASRIDTHADVEKAQKFNARFVTGFNELRNDFSPLLIPYVGRYSYGESVVARLAEREPALELIGPYNAMTDMLVAWGVRHAGLKRKEFSAESFNSGEPAQRA